MKQHTIKALLLTTGVASILQTANAAPLIYNADDLFLGFRSSNSTTDFLINIGQASIYRDAAPGVPFSLSIGSIAADLSAVFGANWNSASRPDIFWGVVGTPGGSAAVGSDATNTLYATTQQNPLGSATSTPAAPGSNSAQAAVANRFVALSQGYLSGVDSNGGVTPAVNPAGLRQDGTAAGSWQVFNGGVQPATGNSFSYFANGIEGDFGSGNEGSAIDLYRISKNPSGVASLEGRFTINDAGLVTFANGVPEPTSAMMLCLGASVLGFTRRRRA